MATRMVPAPPGLEFISSTIDLLRRVPCCLRALCSVLRHCAPDATSGRCTWAERACSRAPGGRLHELVATAEEAALTLGQCAEQR